MTFRMKGVRDRIGKRREILGFGVTFLGNDPEVADQNPGLQSCSINTSSNNVPLPRVLLIAISKWPQSFKSLIHAVSASNVDEIL